MRRSVLLTEIARGAHDLISIAAAINQPLEQTRKQIQALVESADVLCEMVADEPHYRVALPHVWRRSSNPKTRFLLIVATHCPNTTPRDPLVYGHSRIVRKFNVHQHELLIENILHFRFPTYETHPCDILRYTQRESLTLSEVLDACFSKRFSTIYLPILYIPPQTHCSVEIIDGIRQIHELNLPIAINENNIPILSAPLQIPSENTNIINIQSNLETLLQQLKRFSKQVIQLQQKIRLLHVKMERANNEKEKKKYQTLLSTLQQKLSHIAPTRAKLIKKFVPQVLASDEELRTSLQILLAQQRIIEVHDQKIGVYYHVPPAKKEMKREKN